ncbi:MAG: hypothetical protein HN817_02100, partial [Porticoccaceae bacterium]|nr:hypothetical protein [Porticoccaceae bacterium]
MVLPLLKNRAIKKAMENAKSSYYKAADLSGVSRESRIYKSRIAGRCRAHLDKVFVEGAEQAEAYQEACLKAASEGHEVPPMPEPKPFQVIKTQNESIYTYVPSEFAKEMYALGNMYQSASVGPSETLKIAQELAERVSFDLGLEEPFTALQFLRDELEDAAEDSE